MRGELWSVGSQLFGDGFRLPLYVTKLVGALMLFVTSLIVTRLAIKNVIYLERTYMPSIIFTLISSAFYNNYQSLAPLFAAMMIAVGSSSVMRSYMVKTIASKRIFSAAIYFGIAGVFYPPAFYLAPLLLVALGLFRLGSFKEQTEVVVGVVLPISLYFLVLWSFGWDFEGRWALFYDALTLNDGTVSAISNWSFNLMQYTFIAICVILFFLSIGRFLKRLKIYKHRSIIGFVFFIFFSLWVVSVMFFSPIRSLYMLPLLALPMSIIIPAFFTAVRPSFWTNFLYALLLFSAVAIHLI